MDAGKAIVEIFKAEGVKAVFGLPGGHVLRIYDGLYDAPEIKHVLVRHEQHAASMAAAYAQLTGEPGVCLVTAGPGETNTLTAVAEAYIGCWPMLVFAGRAPTALCHRGANQEVDTDLIFAPVAKWTVRVDRPDLVVDVVRQAFTIARSGRPGPVVIDIPPDVLSQEVKFEGYVPVGKPSRLRPDSERVGAAAKALSAAKRPIIVAGGGAVTSDASPELVELAERLCMPVLTSLSGRGSIPDSHPLSAGGLGAHRNDLSKRLLAEADVVLGVGVRWEQMESNWTPGMIPAPSATYIQVDIHGEEIGRAVVPQLGIVGDAKLVLADLNAALSDKHPRPTPAALAEAGQVRIMRRELARIEAEADETAAQSGKPIHPLHVIRAVQRVFPKETITGFDVGFIAQQMAGAFPLYKVPGPRSVISPSSFYGMGFVAAALPAAKLVYPNRPALCFVGDGSFQMVMNVLPSAAENKLAVTWIIVNDMALGSIWDVQEHMYKQRVIGTTFTVQPDFAGIARCCGCYGERVEDPAAIEAALSRALAANQRGEPAVLDILVARERTAAAREYFPLQPIR
jgi:acetolactate synthase I/II/III large subunit